MSSSLILPTKLRSYLNSIVQVTQSSVPQQLQDCLTDTPDSQKLEGSDFGLDTGVSGFQVKQLGGLTNKNLLITLLTEPPQKIVLKVLAQDLGRYINRNHEAVISKNLSVKGIGP